MHSPTSPKCRFHWNNILLQPLSIWAAVTLMFHQGWIYIIHNSKMQAVLEVADWVSEWGVMKQKHILQFHLKCWSTSLAPIHEKCQDGSWSRSTQGIKEKNEMLQKANWSSQLLTPANVLFWNFIYLSMDNWVHKDPCRFLTSVFIHVVRHLTTHPHTALLGLVACASVPCPQQANTHTHFACVQYWSLWGSVCFVFFSRHTVPLRKPWFAKRKLPWCTQSCQLLYQHFQICSR